MRDMQSPRPDFVGVFGWLEEEGRVLLVATERDLGAAGRVLCWELPGGKKEPGESDDAALRREMREETGLGVEVGALLFRFHGERFTAGRRRYGWEGRFFALQRTDGEPAPGGDETIDVRWAAITELPSILTAPYHQPIVRWLARGRASGEETFRWDDA